MGFTIALIPEKLSENKELLRLFSKYKRTMSDKDKEVRWVPPVLWHIPIHFLGNISGAEKTEVIKLIETFEPPKSWKEIELRIHNVGGFPSAERARSLWLGVSKTQHLLEAKEEFAVELKSLNLGNEDQEYNPHITLAKFRNPLNAGELIQLGGRKHFGDYKIKEIALIEGVLQGHMTKYSSVFQKEI